MTDEQVVATEVVPVDTAATPVTPSGDTAKPEVAEQQKPVDEKTFTQAQVNELIEKRLARDRAKRERELEAEVRRLAQERAPKVETPSDPAAPKREDFDSYEDFIRADARYVVRQETQVQREAEKRAQSEAKVKQERESAMQEFGKREAQARQKYPDFEDVLETAKTLPITDTMFDAVTLLEEGWDVVHYLGTHPEEAQRISQLHPTRQAAEVGKLAAKIAAPAPKPASVSRAPEPIDTTRPGGSAVIDKPPDDPDEYKKWHDARERAKYQGKRT